MIYADVIIDISHEKLDRDFQYRVPEELVQAIKPGVVVTVPFGKGNTLRKGYVTGISGTAKYDASKLKEIRGVSTDSETTESRLIALAAWMKETYGSTMIQALKTVLPVKDKVRAKEKRLILFTGKKEEGQALLGKLEGSRFKARERFLRAILEAGSLDYTYASKELGAGISVLDFYEKKGYVTSGESIEELAEKMNLPKEDLSQTIETWNTAVAAKKDEQFDRTTAMDHDLSQPNYYAIKIAPGIHYTMGGIKINTNTEVLNKEEQPITGLYAAGEVTGGLHGNNRIGGNSVAEIIIFGRQAGIQAAKYAAEN